MKTNYWNSIRNRLHEESGLHYPYNKMGQILEEYLNGILNDFNEQNIEFTNQGFLITTTGLYLDERGKEMGLPRKEGGYATGSVTFTLTSTTTQESEIEKLQTESIPLNDPERIEEEYIVFNAIPDDVQNILDRINAEHKTTGEPYITILKATSDITIPKDTIIHSTNGFEYVTTKDATIPKDQSTITVNVKARESGVRYNTEEETLTVFDAKSINKNLIVTNTQPITGGTDGETDSQYRQRLLNNVSTNISVNYLKRQGIIIYTKLQTDNNIRTKLTSHNPYLKNKYALIPPNNEVQDFVDKELITDGTMRYKKGW